MEKNWLVPFNWPQRLNIVAIEIVVYTKRVCASRPGLACTRYSV